MTEVWKHGWEIQVGKENISGGGGVITVSLKRSRVRGVDRNTETDKGPLTAASSCFLGLCHHMTPPDSPLDVCLYFSIFILLIAAAQLLKTAADLASLHTQYRHEFTVRRGRSLTS